MSVPELGSKLARLPLTVKVLLLSMLSVPWLLKRTAAAVLNVRPF